MAEVTGGSGIHRDGEGEGKIEARDSREKVLKAFGSAYDLLEQAPQENLTEEELWTKQSIKNAKEKTIDQNKDTFTNTFENHHTAETFEQEEGIPIEGLLDFLRKKLEGLPKNSPEWQNIINLGHTLYRNSRFYHQLPHRMEPEKWEGRLHQEAYFISQDSRATGSELNDWLKATGALNKRIELVLPKGTLSPTEETVTIPETTESPPTEKETTEGETPENPPPEPVTPEPQPIPVEQVRRELDILRRDLDIRKTGEDLARQLFDKEMRRGSALNPLNLGRKIGLRIMEDYWKKRIIQQLRTVAHEQNNSYLELDVARSSIGFLDLFRRDIRKLQVDTQAHKAEEVEAGKAEISRVRQGIARPGERIEEAQGQLRQMIIDEVLRPAVEGQITNEAEAQQRLRQFIQAHENDPQVQATFGRDATQYGRLAEYFATDLTELAEQIRQDLASHKYAIEQLNEVVTIRLANVRWAAETQAEFNATDRAIAWAERHRLTGVLLNPATIGAAFSLGTYGALRAAGVGGTALQFAVPGAGIIPGALFAAFRRNYDLKVDMAGHRVGEAYGRRIGPESPRREALEQRTYNTASANELRNGGGIELLTGTARRSLQELLRQDLSEGQQSNREAVARRIAEINTRLDFSAREHVDLVTFESRYQVQQGRWALEQAVVEAREVLRNVGMSDAEIAQLETRFTGDWNTRFTQNREQQDRAFRNYRVRNAIGAGIFGGAAGLGTGLLVQEGIAVGQRLAGAEAGQTVIERGLGLLGIRVGETPPPISTITNTLQTLYQNGGNVDVSQSLTFQVGPDHAVSIIDRVSGQPLADAPKIVLGTDGHLNATGNLPQGLSDELQQSGFQIDQGPDITEPGQTIVEQKTVLGPNGEWTKHATNIDHREWYSYDQPGSQGNELRFYTRQDGETVILDMTNMKQGFQRELVPNPIDVQEVIANKEAGWYFSLPNLPQEGLWVSEGADGTWDGMLRLDPNADPSLRINPADSNSMTLAEFSKIAVNQEALKVPPGGTATEFNSRQDVFNLGQDEKYGFIEAGRIVDRDGVKVLQDFATIRGSSPVPETIDITTEILPKTIPTLDIIPPPAHGPEAPPIIPIPFAPRHPLEPLGAAVPVIPEYYPYYPERAFPEGARLADILRRGRPEPSELRRAYRAEGEIIVDRQEGERALAETRQALESADSAYVVLGGAIGDAVISTAHLGGVQEALRSLNKNVPITLVVNEDHGDLFEGFASTTINVVKAPRGQGLQTAMERVISSNQTQPLIIDLEQYRIENPTIEMEQQGDKKIITLHNLLAPAIQLYNNSTDQERRFADYVGDLFSLPKNSINSERAMPRIELPQDKDVIYENLLGTFGIDRAKPQIAIVVESQIAEKRYPLERWTSVISQIFRQNPQYQFNIIFNPHSQTTGFTRTDIKNSLTAAGVLEQSRLVSGSLLEMAVLLERQNIVLSNDTGLAHIATALEHGPSVVSLHIPYFPPNFWVANPKKQTGILPPEGEANIAGIPPEEVARKALEILQATVPVVTPATPPPSPQPITTAQPSPEVLSPPPAGLPKEINQNIAESVTDSVRYETSPETFTNYLKTLSLPMGARLGELNARIENGQIITSGTVNAVGASSRFTATLTTTPQGQLQIASRNIQLALLHRPFMGQVENAIGNLNQIVTDQINSQINPSWEVARFSLLDGKLVFDLRKKLPPAEPIRVTPEQADGPRLEAAKKIAGRVRQVMADNPDMSQDDAMTKVRQEFEELQRNNPQGGE